MTLVEMLERNASQTPDKVALISHDGTYSYGLLNETVNRVADGLLRLGIERGDRVAFMMPRIPELIIGFLAVAKAGAVAAPVNFDLPVDSIALTLKRMSPKAVIADGQFLDLALNAADSASVPVRIAVHPAKRDADVYTPWNEFLEDGSVKNPGLAIKGDDVVYLNYTSGSTGESRGAVTTHLNIYWNTLASVEALSLTSNDVHLCMFAPFAHPHELFARALFLSGTIVLVDKISPKGIAEAISDNKVSCMMGLAPMYENLLELLEYKAYNLSSLRIPESGGMFTRPELMQRFREKVGVSIVPVWGSTETTGIAIAVRPVEGAPDGSVGRVCPYYDVRVIDDNGNETPSGEVGEMIFKGAGVVSGYYETGVNNASYFKDGWYHSADFVRRDAEGFYYFVDRKSGMMKVAGLKVYPSEVESAINAHPFVKESAVVAVKDHLRGEVPKAVVVLKDGCELTTKALLRHCKTIVASYKAPRVVEFVQALPKTNSGKINKKALQTELI